MIREMVKRGNVERNLYIHNSRCRARVSALAMVKRGNVERNLYIHNIAAPV
jgi:hypothetical protein